MARVSKYGYTLNELAEMRAAEIARVAAEARRDAEIKAAVLRGVNRAIKDAEFEAWQAEIIRQSDEYQAALRDKRGVKARGFFTGDPNKKILVKA